MDSDSFERRSGTGKAKNWLCALLVMGTVVFSFEGHTTPCAQIPPTSSAVESWSEGHTFFLTITGGMMRVGDTRYVSALKRYRGEKRVIILLNSTGGIDVYEKLIVDQIDQWKKQGVEVVVRIPSDAEASSAALTILTAGSWRSAAPSALFGLHGVAVLGDDLFFHVSPEETKKWTDHLVRLGAKASWIDQHYQAGNFKRREFTCLKPQDLINGNMLDEIVEDVNFR